MALDPTIGRRNVTVFVENGVSSLSREFPIITIAEVNAIAIKPVSVACLRDLEAPAVEVNVTCLMTVIMSHGFTTLSSLGAKDHLVFDYSRCPTIEKRLL